MKKILRKLIERTNLLTWRLKLREKIGEEGEKI